MRIQGLAALVTGGSRGLGAALGRTLARGGARVVLAARGREDLDAVTESIRAAGGEAHALVADVSDAEGVHGLLGAAAALVGPVRLLVHNASTLGPTPLQPLSDTPSDQFAHVLELNLLAPFRLTQVVLGSMLVRGEGLVVHVTSDAGVVAYPRWGAYGVSKAALDHLARCWAAELEGSGIRVLSVDPGEMRTRMHAAADPDADPSTLADPDAVAEALVALIREGDAVPSGSRLELARWRKAPA